MDDTAIVQLYWDRDERALSVTAEKYGGYCAAIARNILGSPEDAEECVNDAFLLAWDSMPPHRPAILSTFLGKLTRNVSLNRFQYNLAGKRGGGTAQVFLDEIAELVSDTDHVEREIDRGELINAINGFLKRLSPKQRSVFVCRYWYFDSVSEIASRFGMSENHVSVTLHRLRAKLRDHLLKGGFTL